MADLQRRIAMRPRTIQVIAGQRFICLAYHWTATAMTQRRAAIASRLRLPRMPWIALPAKMCPWLQRNAAGTVSAVAPGMPVTRSSCPGMSRASGSTPPGKKMATRTSNASESPRIQRIAALKARRNCGFVRETARASATSAVTSWMPKPRSDSGRYTDQMIERAHQATNAINAEGRCMILGSGFLLARSQMAPATMIATMTPNPYQVSRFRQKSPANAVKNVKVAKAVRPGLPGTRAARLRQGARAVSAESAGIRVELTGLFSLTRASPRFFVSEYGVCVGQGERHTKAAWPVIDLPTMRVFISLVPSYE
ncbi:hypothetical protein ACFPRL_11280 [Pseudoclavibacter helvolus]